MKRSLRAYPLLLLSLSLTHTLFSADRPLPRTLTVKAEMITNKSLSYYDTSFHAKEVKETSKVCACQILKVNSKNHRDLRIAVLVEKTKARHNADRAMIRQLFEKEKRYMRYFFYDEIRTISYTLAPTNCQLLFQKLKAANIELQLYQVLDADVKRGI